MYEFQNEAQDFLKITAKEWNILREIKDSRNTSVHKSLEKILIA